MTSNIQRTQPVMANANRIGRGIWRVLNPIYSNPKDKIMQVHLAAAVLEWLKVPDLQAYSPA